MEAAQFQELCSKDWTVTIKHTFREGKYVANYIAFLGYDCPIGSHTFFCF
ncbi:hypothetical protein LINPERPRIM_LOCUS20463 [Linum perenne]